MKRNNYILIAGISTAMIMSAPVTAQESRLCQPGNFVFFGNGVLNDADQAAAGTFELQILMESRVAGTNLEGTITYGTSHNDTGGIILDVLETVVQRAETAVSSFWGALAGIDILPDFIQDALVSASSSVDQLILKANPSVQEHVNKYNAVLGEGNKVVLVPHSQGNLYANIGYVGIDDDFKSGYGIVSVANPDSFVAGGGPYTTIAEDIVIAAVPGSLPGNLDNFAGFNNDDFSGHEFVTSYLAPFRPAQDRILSQVETYLNGTLVAPDVGINTGLITATLTWGDEPDVDLHVYEPNGSHVYYQNLQGPSGFLDLDDTSGFGPEHYFASCNSVETGTYTFGVNYFSGQDPEVATINLKAGELIFEQSGVLGESRGSSGNNSPTLFFDLNVSGSRDLGYEFSVVPY